MASIKQRGENGGWEARIRKIGYPAQVKTFGAKRDAEAWARKTESMMEQRLWLDKSEADATTLAEALERYQAQVVAGKKGAVKESSIINLWARSHLAGLALGRIRGADVAKLADGWLAEGYAPATVVRRLAVLSHLFSIARRRWAMEGLSNPVEAIEKPKIKNDRKRRVSEAEIVKICAATESAVLPAFIRLAVETAARREELTKLTWKNINLQSRTARLLDTKNGEDRTVPLSTAAVAVLSALPRNPSGKVFAVTPDAVTRAYARAVSRAHAMYIAECAGASDEPDTDFLADLTLHDLRHEATSRLADIFQAHELAKITGHKDMKMLLRYYHPRASDLAKRLA